jgi:hypothetical protein
MSATQPFRHSARQANVPIALSNRRGLIGVLIAVFGGLLLPSPAVRAQGIAPVAALVTDQTALDVSTNFGTPAAAAVNERGDYAFVGNDNGALFLRRAGSATIERLLQQSDPVPGFNGSIVLAIAAFGSLPNGSLNSNGGLNSLGHLVFRVNFSLSDGFVHQAILMYDGAAFHTLVCSDNIAPICSDNIAIAPGTGGQIYGPNLQVRGFDDSDNLTFTDSNAPLGPVVAGTPISIYFLPAGGPAARIAGPGDPVPAAGQGAIFLPQGNPIIISVNSQGQTLFRSTVVVGGVTRSGLFLGSAVGVQVVVLQGVTQEPSPPAPANTFFPGPTNNALLSDAGVVTFFASNIIWTDTPPPPGLPPAAPAAIAQNGTAVPAVGGTISFAAFTPSLFATDAAGDLLFSTAISGSNNGVTFAILRHTSAGAFQAAYSFVPNALGAAPFFGAGSMSSSGLASFVVFTQSSNPTLYQQSGTAAPLAVAANGQGQAAPVSGGGVFAALSAAFTRTMIDGSTYFASSITGGTAYYGEFRGTPGNIQGLMSTADTLPAGGRINFGNPQAKDPFVAFSAERSGGRATLFVMNFAGTPTKLVSEGDSLGGNGGVFSSILLLPNRYYVNANAQVVFEGATSTGGEGIFIASPFTGVNSVAFIGDSAPVPGNPSFTNFTVGSNFTPSPLNDLGQVAFGASLSNGQSGVFLGFPGIGTQKIAVGSAPGFPGDIAPGGGTFAAIPGNIGGSPVVNGFGQVAFAANFTPAAGGGKSGFFVGSAGGAPSKIVASGDVQSGATTFGTLEFIDSFTNSGQVAFLALLNTGGVTTGGMFIGQGGGIPTTVAIDGTNAPGTGGGMFATELSLSATVSAGVTVYSFSPSADLYINDEGDVLLRARVVGGNTNSGLFRQLSWQGGAIQLQLIASQGQGLPGVGTLSTISAAQTPGAWYRLGDGGDVALINSFTNSGGVKTLGIFAIHNDGTLVKLIAAGDPVPGTSGMLASAGNFPVASGDGDVILPLSAPTGTSRETIEIMLTSGGGTATSTTVFSSLNPTIFGQTVTFTATVSGLNGPVGQEDVGFIDNGSLIGLGSLSASGHATFSTSSLTAGAHVIVAVFAGTHTFAPSISSAVNQTVNVNPATLPTFMSLNSSPNSVSVGQSVLLTASVAGAGGTPTGLVTFSDGDNVIGAGGLDATGVTSFGTASLAAGFHDITAQYLGDTHFLPAFSETSLTIGSAAAGISVQVTPIPENVPAGGSQKFTATTSDNQGVTWQWEGPGALDSMGNYVAPAAISPTMVTVTATSVTDPTRTASVRFTIAADALTDSQPPATVSAGSQLTLNIQLAGVPTDSAVPFTLSCSNPPLGSTCAFNPPAVTGQNPNFTFTVTTGGGSSAGLTLPQGTERPGPWPVLLAMSLLMLLLIVSRGSTSPLRMRPALFALVLLCLSVACLVSCSGIPNSSVQAPAAKAITPSGNYQVRVIATPPSGSGNFVQTQLIVPFTVQ